MQPSKIEYDAAFRQNYTKRIATDPDLVDHYHQRLKLFISDRTDPKLSDHHLNWRMQGLRAFSITKDIRVIYEEAEGFYVFKDIGTHNQVYK